MYLESDEIEFEALRQGDILSGIHILGALTLNNIHYATDQEGVRHTWSYTQKPSILPAMVLSHSCEIALENKVKLTSIILAPIRDVSTATRSDKVQELIDSNILDEDSEYSYLKYFYVIPHDGIGYERGGVVDFSKCFSLRKNSFDTLLDRKILQLNSQTQQAMSLKLAAYYYRQSDTA